MHRCGDGPVSDAFGAQSLPIFWLDGTTAVGVATTASGVRLFQVILDLTGTRLNGFDGRFYDADYSAFRFELTRVSGNGYVDQVHEGFGPEVDPTGRTTFAYTLSYVVYPTPVLGQGCSGCCSTARR